MNLRQFWHDTVYWLTVRPRLNRLKRLLPDAEIYPCGSRYVCNPPVLLTDIDFLVYCEAEIGLELGRTGYSYSTFQGYFHSGHSDFISWRKGSINLIVTHSKKYMVDHNLATSICKTKNIRAKYHRIIIHEALRGNTVFIDEIMPDNFNHELRNFLLQANGPFGHAIRKAYMVQNGLNANGWPT